MVNNAEYNEDPEITKLFLWVTAVESGVLIIAGCGLLFFPWIMGPSEMGGVSDNPRDNRQYSRTYHVVRPPNQACPPIGVRA